MTVAYHCELAWLGGEQAEPDVVVTVDGERIATVEPGVAQPPPGATRLAGLTVPGFANAHSHAFHRALRGRTHTGSGSFWTWRDQMYRVAASLDPDSYHRLARATFAEMALAGISTVGEFHYLHHGPGGVPYANQNIMSDALIEAAAEAGLRMTLLDTCYLHGGIDQELAETQHRFADAGPDAWAERASALTGGPAVRIGAAIHSVRAVDPTAMRIVAEWAAGHRAPSLDCVVERGATSDPAPPLDSEKGPVRNGRLPAGVPIHAHVSEQPAENEQCQAAFGRTPVELLAEAGVLGERFTAVHATHLTEDDIGLLGGGRCWCCLCPTTERDLADGIGPSVPLRAAGAGLTLGSDSHAVIDILEEARAVELDERLASGGRGHHDPASLLRMATADGHASLGWPDAGRLEPGAYADLTTIGLDSVRLAGTRPSDAVAAAVFAGTAADIRHVVISGRVVVSDGHHTTVDIPAELSRALG